jgi:UDP:flavonoid glycosyltransferase YjiC (YdhE family)
MTRVVVAASPIYGHFAPMRAVAADLVRRGHQVTVTTGSKYREAVEAVGARFAPLLGAADFDGDDVPALFPEILSIAPGPEQIGFGLRHLFIDPVPDQHRTVQELLAADDGEPVVLVHETGFLGAWPVLLGAAGSRPSAVVGLGVVPLTISSADTAPFGLGLPPDSSPEGQERNRAANAMVQEAVFGSTQEHLVKVLASCGATEQAPFIMDGISRLPDRFLQLSIGQLDYPRSDLPDSIRYVGALPAGSARNSELPTWWDEVASAPRVVVVSQGTAANVDFSELVQPTLDALADLDVLVIATLGRDAESELERVPANARVAEFIPFDDLLPQTDVLVSNGGFGGVQQALGHGVPMVLAGQTEDKAEVTARAAWAGAAINLATQRPEAQDVRAAVEKVLTEAAYRERAAELAAKYARHDALTAIHETVTELGR